MKWFHHETNLRNKPYMNEAMNLYGHQAYAFYLITMEIYGENYNSTDECGQLKITLKYLRNNARISEKKLRILLTYFQKEEMILYKIIDNSIIYKIPKFIDLVSNWTKRKGKKKLSTPTEVPTALEEEEEKEIIIINNNKKDDDVDKINNEDDMTKMIKRDAKNIIKHLNERLNLEYKDTKYIEKRLREDENPEDYYLIIERMKENEFFKKNRHLYAPKYLFKKENFEMYLNQ